MTLNGAIMQLVELSEHPIMPVIFRPSIQKVIETISELEENPEPHWISCNERLPQQGQEVICQCRANIIKVLKLDANGDWYQDAEHCYMSGFVIAWMPLPEPYKGEQE